jgi:2-dehydropantoate 2-reductase
VGFLARRDAATLASRGLLLHQTSTPQVAGSEVARLHMTPTAFQVASDPHALKPPDWLLIALKTTALDALPALAGPLIGPRTRVVALCNGLGAEERLAELAPPQQVLGLVCFVCINRDADGTIHHLAHGQLTAGSFTEDPEEAARLVELWTSAGITCHAPSSLREARWRKLVWNVPFNGLGVVHDLTTDRILADPALLIEARTLMREVIAAANADLAAAGRTERLEDAWADEQERRTHEMGAYVSSTLMDARAGAPLELDALFGEPLRRAERLGVATPALQRLWAALGRQPLPSR